MKTRPTSVTVISWILIVMGGISLVTSTVMLNNPMVEELMKRSPFSPSVQYALMYIGLFVTITSGAAMLKGQNWARLLYVIWSAIGFLISLTTSPVKTAAIPGLIIYLVIVTLLFRPNVNRYFGTQEAGSGA